MGPGPHDAELHIWEPAAYFGDEVDGFCVDLERLGFELVGRPSKQGLFMYIRAIKTTSVPVDGTMLHFRGRS